MEPVEASSAEPEPTVGRQSLLHRLNGAELLSVTFISDHLALTFERMTDDGQLIHTPRLDCFVWPAVETPEGAVTFGATGYRDALCQCIGAAVTDVRDDAVSGMRLRFRDKSLVIRPTDDELRGPEIAVLHFRETEEWDLWRPGEDAFACLT